MAASSRDSEDVLAGPTVVDWVFVLGAVTGVGGTETRMSEAAQLVVQEGGRVKALVWADSVDTILVQTLVAAGVQVHTTRNVISYLSFLCSHRGATFFTFGLRPSVVMRVLRAITGHRSTILGLRNGLDASWAPWMHKVDRLSSRWQDAYLVNSQAVRDHLIKWGAKSDSIFLVEGALGSEWSAPAERAKRDKPVIAMVGNDRTEKNQLFGLETMLRLDSSIADIRIFTDDATRLRSALAQRSSPAVTFVEGHRLTPSDYDDIDILVMPSLSESVPRTILEARARGCQVVTSDAGSSASMIDAMTSTVVRGFDPSDWEAALRIAIEHHRRLSRVNGDAGRSTGEYVADVKRLVRGLMP